jgi:small subunit ribosomal protein S17
MKKIKHIHGIVVGKVGNKTVKVLFLYKKRHSMFYKEIKRKTVFYVHDENNKSNINDKVIIKLVRPISKKKRFKIVSINKFC